MGILGVQPASPAPAELVNPPAGDTFASLLELATMATETMKAAATETTVATIATAATMAAGATKSTTAAVVSEPATEVVASEDDDPRDTGEALAAPFMPVQSAPVPPLPQPEVDPP
ncbi:MAG TPA: hypothetical protein PLL69_09770, partial [Gemmatimonadales bacterium]|nr:hypothetical protein [Gemmatimonadales bacterium]